MVKNQALVVLSNKLQVGGDEWTEEITELTTKANTMPEESFAECKTFADLREMIHHYKAPRKPTQSNGKKTYYKLTEPIADASEKAIGIVTGENNLHGSLYREYIQWIPTSQIIEENNNIYIPAWIVSNNLMWHVVNKNEKITR